jgi:hypothetical protein
VGVKWNVKHIHFAVVSAFMERMLFNRAKT